VTPGEVLTLSAYPRGRLNSEQLARSAAARRALAAGTLSAVMRGDGSIAVLWLAAHIGGFWVHQKSDARSRDSALGIWLYRPRQY
jgi:hypothetical protein